MRTLRLHRSSQFGALLCSELQSCDEVRFHVSDTGDGSWREIDLTASQAARLRDWLTDWCNRHPAASEGKGGK
jgi:hypothetical protein